MAPFYSMRKRLALLFGSVMAKALSGQTISEIETTQNLPDFLGGISSLGTSIAHGGGVDIQKRRLRREAQRRKIGLSRDSSRYRCCGDAWIDALVTHRDMLPSLAEIFGVAPKKHLNGTSLRPLLATGIDIVQAD